MAVRKPLVVGTNGLAEGLPNGDTLEGTSGAPQVFVQATRPAGNGPWTWWQTSNGVIVDLIVADGLA